MRALCPQITTKNLAGPLGAAIKNRCWREGVWLVRLSPTPSASLFENRGWEWTGFEWRGKTRQDGVHYPQFLSESLGQEI